MNRQSTERRARRKTGPAAPNDTLQAMRKSLGALETKAGRLGLPLVSHMIGVAGLLVVERLTEETTG